MMNKSLIVLFCTVLMLGGCILPPWHDLHRTQRLVTQAVDAGAPELAPTEYSSAVSALESAERLIARRKYKRAVETLSLSRGHARRALTVSEQEPIPAPAPEPEPAKSEETPPPLAQEEKKTDKKPKTNVRKESSKPPPPPPLVRYTVSQGETLWLIAARREVYGEPLLWPLLYRANRDQIRDPRQIHAGQILDIPRGISAAERKEAIERARVSEVFPVGSQLQKPSP
jgi:nucleoid-associated protein YgaU